MAFKMEANTTQISNIFIDYYLPKAQPAYVLAYLYAYRHLSGGNASLSDEDIAKALNMLVGDVGKAWEYWEAQGLIRRNNGEEVEFLTVEQPITKSSLSNQGSIIISKQPEYSPMELARYLESSETVKELFLMGQTHLGKLLSQNDMSILFGFYDWLRLPLEVIEILLVYAVKNNHRSLHYIEKIAVTWAEEGIDNPQKAMEHIKLRSVGHREIMKAFGIHGRSLLPAEEEYAKKWVQEYGMPQDIIALACEKTIIQTGKISFPYADTILTKWRDAGIRSKAAVEEQEKQFQQAGKAKKLQKEKALAQKKAAAPSGVKQNRFVNYEQRQWDFDELARLERDRRKRLNQQTDDAK